MPVNSTHFSFPTTAPVLRQTNFNIKYRNYTFQMSFRNNTFRYIINYQDHNDKKKKHSAWILRNENKHETCQNSIIVRNLAVNDLLNWNEEE